MHVRHLMTADASYQFHSTKVVAMSLTLYLPW